MKMEIQARRRKQLIILAAALLGMLTGCSRREEADILEKKPRQEAEEQNRQQGESTLDVRELVQAPARYQAGFAGEKVRVEADAEVIVPEAEGFYEY